jgi:hypothetical protein
MTLDDWTISNPSGPHAGNTVCMRTGATLRPHSSHRSWPFRPGVWPAAPASPPLTSPMPVPPSRTLLSLRGGLEQLGPAQYHTMARRCRTRTHASLATALREFQRSTSGMVIAGITGMLSATGSGYFVALRGSRSTFSTQYHSILTHHRGMNRHRRFKVSSQHSNLL